MLFRSLDAFGRAALQGRQYRVRLMGQKRDDHEVVRRLFVEHAGHPDAGPLALDVNDRTVALKVLQPEGAWPRDDSDIVTTVAGQLEGKRAADLSSAEDSDPERGSGNGHGGSWHLGHAVEAGGEQMFGSPITGSSHLTTSVNNLRQWNEKMSVDSKELSAIYSEYISCLNRQDWPGLCQFVHDDVQHNGQPFGLSGYRKMLARDFESIPDLRFHVQMLITEVPFIASRLVSIVRQKANCSAFM